MSQIKLLSLVFLFWIPTFALFGQEETKATAEVIYRMPDFPTDEFEIDSVIIQDGYKAYNVEHKVFAQSYYHLIYDADNRLRLILMACSECDPMYAWIIDYNADYNVEKITIVSDPTETNYTIELENLSSFADIANWLKQHYLEQPVTESLALDFVRENGHLVKIGGVFVPENHIVEYEFFERKHFWDADIIGGNVFFLIHVYAEDMSGKGAINRYYLENDLLLDCLYDDNGKFVKAKAFDSKGRQRATYKNPNLNLQDVIEDVIYR